MGKFRTMIPAGADSWNIAGRIDRIRIPKDQGRHGRLKIEKGTTLARYDFRRRGFGPGGARYIPRWWHPDPSGQCFNIWPPPKADVEVEIVQYFWLRPFFVLARKLGFIAP